MATVDLASSIGQKWQEIEAAGGLGNPLNDVQTMPDGEGALQEFEKGAIFYSPAYGAVWIASDVYKKWRSSSVASGTTETGETIQNYMGYPIEDSFVVPNTMGGNLTYFERGMIITGHLRINHEPVNISCVLYENIYLRYRQLGDIKIPNDTPYLGLPISDERTEPNGGRATLFEHGVIYWNPTTGAWDISEDIYGRWQFLGGVTGLGYPTSGHTNILKNSAVIGAYNSFEHGDIYWSTQTGAWEIYGAIEDKWQNIDGPTGALGFPVSGENSTPASGGRYNNFEHGVIVWHGGGPYDGAYSIIDLRLYVESFNVNHDFNVQINIVASTGEANHGRTPSDGEFSGGTQKFSLPEANFLTVAKVQSTLVIDLKLEAISQRRAGQDDRKGTLIEKYTIDNVWGILDISQIHQNAEFTAEYRFEPITLPEPFGEPRMFWPFGNFNTDKLSWEECADTFRDIEETDKKLRVAPWDLSIHPLEWLFYESIYSSLAQNGNCFGMCLEAIYARVKRSLFIEPLYSSPFNAYDKTQTVLAQNQLNNKQVAHEINVKHGYQLGIDMIEYFLTKWLSGGLHQPVNAFLESRDAFNRGDWPLISLSDENELSQNGHVVLPYAWIGGDPGFPSEIWKIYVHDPNRPPMGSDFLPKIYIEVDFLLGEFRYTHSNGKVWTGSTETGGRMFYIPYSQLAVQPSSPTDILHALLTGSIVLVIVGDCETKQITDENGKTFYSYAQGEILPEKQFAAKTDRIPDMALIPLYDQNDSSTKALEIYCKRSDVRLLNTPTRAITNQTLKCELDGGKEGVFHWGFFSPQMSAVISVPALNQVSDLISVEQLGSSHQSIKVKFSSNDVAKQSVIAVGGWSQHIEEFLNWFELKNITTSGEPGIVIQIDKGGKDLLIQNEGADINLDMRLHSGKNADSVAIRTNVSLEANRAFRLSPSDWTPTAINTATISVHVMDKIGGTVILQRTI